MKALGVRRFGARREREPALSALLGGPSVPGDEKRLDVTAAKLDEILLQRKQAEGVADRKIARLARSADRVDDRCVTASEEPVAHAAVDE